jgi:hypothetical protein
VRSDLSKHQHIHSGEQDMTDFSLD